MTTTRTRLTLLGAVAGGLLALPLTAAPALAQVSPCGPTTTVQPGDTYFAISQRCDVSVSFIEQANPGVDPYSLQIGQTLQLTLSDAGQAEPMPDTYEVRAGDTVFSIAAALGTTVEAILSANPAIDPDALQIGQIIRPPTLPPPGGGDAQVVRGVLTAEGVQCQAMRGQDGQLYTLIGNDVDQYDEGDFVEVRGSVPDASICLQGITIDVDQIRQVG